MPTYILTKLECREPWGLENYMMVHEVENKGFVEDFAPPSRKIRNVFILDYANLTMAILKSFKLLFMISNIF